MATKYLRGLGGAGRYTWMTFLHILWRRYLLLLPVCVPTHQQSSENGSTLKAMSLLPRSKSFLSSRPLFKRGQNSLDTVVSLENVSVPFNEIVVYLIQLSG